MCCCCNLAEAPLTDESTEEIPFLIIIIVCVIGVILLILNILLIVFFIHKRRKKFDRGMCFLAVMDTAVSLSFCSICLAGSWPINKNTKLKNDRASSDIAHFILEAFAQGHSWSSMSMLVPVERLTYGLLPYISEILEVTRL